MDINNILPEIDLEALRGSIENVNIDEVKPNTGNITPLFDFDKGEFVFDINNRNVVDDGLEGMKGIIAKAHATARNAYIIYSENYGSDEEEALRTSAPEEVRQMLVKEAIRDCLIYDDRVEDISEIELTKQDDAYLAVYTVYTIFGSVEVERGVI